ncbi:cytochrome P450 [Xylariomycetidae sp. FL0641]|nr:cytochrome P450 [Xylariomycetidae sp. FL0641]
MFELSISLILRIGAFLVAFLVFQYFYSVSKYHRQRRATGSVLPPTYPGLIPYLGHAILFLHNAPGFLSRATSYSGQLTSTAIQFLPGLKIYFFQDPETVETIWKRSNMLNAVRLRVYAYKYLFGMPKKWASVYEEDDSGPFPKPLAGSNVHPDRRIHRFLAEGIDKALSGPGLAPTYERLGQRYANLMNSKGFSNTWIEMGDLRKFMHCSLGLSTIESIFGPKLVELSPSFMDELFEFNFFLPWLSKGIPRFMMPKPYRIRQSLQDSIKCWYQHAREGSDASQKGEDGDSDAFWGSSWMRQRQGALAYIQDDSTLASSDLGVAWASTENLVRNATMAMIHILQDRTLFLRVREDLDELCEGRKIEDVNIKLVANNPLLSSIYAETLRLHVKTYTVVYSSHSNVDLGKYWLPRRSVGLVNSYMSHMNDKQWNTADGHHPLDTFWAKRFLIDPSDPTSGPLNPARRGNLLGPSPDQTLPEGTNSPRFSTEGLEGSWIPYGGGRLMCPGRFLAKNAIILACATLVKDFDVELLTDDIKLESRSFGLGSETPRSPVPFRIRKRFQDES